MAKSFEVTSANIKSRIDSVSFNSSTGQVTVKVSLWEPRMKPLKLVLAQYLLPGGSWTDCTLNSSGLQKNTNIYTPGRWKQYSLMWDAFEDVDLTSYNGVQVKVRFQDNGGTNDTEQVSSSFNMDLSPMVVTIVDPITFGKDTTPEVIFEVPSALSPCNMHFQIVISQNSDLSNPVQTIDSSVDQTGWEFQIDGVYKPMLSPGCPDISALDPGAKCKHTLQNPLASGTYYFEVTPKGVTKKDTTSGISLTPEQMTLYTINY